MRRAVLALLSLFAAAGAYDDSERGNLLDIASGASVVFRTGELTLDQSAVRAIDGDPQTSWNSPPNDFRQTIVFALPAIARVDAAGIKTPRAPVFRVAAVQFDSSIDGVNFTPLLRPQLADSENVQLFPVPPRDLLYLRVTTLDAKGPYTKLDSVLLHGKYLQPIRQQPIDGCWSINGFAASFATDRGRITGTIGGDHPMSFDGGSDGLVYRFIWTSGPDYGFGAIDTAPDRKHLSGLRWYVEPIQFSSAESWFGERTKCSGPAQRPADAAIQFLRRAKRFPLYGLHFDANGAVDQSQSAATLDMIAAMARAKRHRLVSREFRMPDAAANKQTARRRLDSLRAVLQKRGVDPNRFDWIAIGSDAPPRAIQTEIQRVLYGVVELQPL